MQSRGFIVETTTTGGGGGQVDGGNAVGALSE